MQYTHHSSGSCDPPVMAASLSYSSNTISSSSSTLVISSTTGNYKYKRYLEFQMVANIQALSFPSSVSLVGHIVPLASWLSLVFLISFQQPPKG